MARDVLTRQQIIGAAIELLDREGLDGLSMRVLGQRLGSAATAVYWHVGNKDNLVALAADSVWDEIVLPDYSATEWRRPAMAMASGLHQMLTRHLWLVQAFGTVLMYGPGKARYDDHHLAIYEAAGLSPAEADGASATVFMFVLGNALGPAAADSLTKKLDRERQNAAQLIQAEMMRAIEIANQFPRLRRRRLSTASAADYTAPPANSFELGLETILDGLETRLKRKTGCAETPGA